MIRLIKFIITILLFTGVSSCSVTSGMNAPTVSFNGGSEILIPEKNIVVPIVDIDLDTLEPHINGPFTPDLATPISKFADLAKENNWPTEIPALAESEGMNSYINSEVERLNKELAKFETIKRFKILHEDFDVEHGTLTPSMKIKRKPINERYEEQINSLYEN